MTNKQWLLDVETNSEGEAFIQLTDEMLSETNFAIGDELTWSENLDGSFTLTKKEPETEWVLVEAIQSYRMRYMVEVPKGKSEWAMDTVACEEAKEFSQFSLGETITSGRVISKEDALAICDQDNSYCKVWADDMKMQAFFTGVNDEVVR